ncbi:MAG: choice-of-anchor D domain-containing protein, partial [Xanthomonadales bacterium]|nr:choice-of-anchor D domain-containing protein [Xanthomonadales bacterium]
MSVTFTPSAGGGRPYAASSTVCRPPALFGQCLPIIIGQPAPVLARLRYAGVGSGSLARVAPTRIDFGSQLLGTQTNVVLSITNPTSNLQTYDTQLLLSNPSGFSIPTQSCGFGLVGFGLTCSITFRFAPTVPGATTSMTRITVSSGTLSEAYDIELAGTGISTATPSYTAPMRLDFGDVGVGALATIPVTTRNAAGQALTVTAAPFGSADALSWTRVPQAACLAPIANGATCRHDYSFSPRAAGGYSINTQLAVTGTGVNQSVPLSLSGNGVGSLVEVTPLNLDLGLLAIGNTATGRVNITNTSANTLARTFSGSAPFVSSTSCGASLAPGASCFINYSLVADGDPLGPVESEATLLFSNVVPGDTETVTVNLRAQVTDLLFANGFE